MAGSSSVGALYYAPDEESRVGEAEEEGEIVSSMSPHHVNPPLEPAEYHTPEHVREGGALDVEDPTRGENK